MKIGTKKSTIFSPLAFHRLPSSWETAKFHQQFHGIFHGDFHAQFHEEISLEHFCKPCRNEKRLEIDWTWLKVDESFGGESQIRAWQRGGGHKRGEFEEPLKIPSWIKGFQASGIFVHFSWMWCHETAWKMAENSWFLNQGIFRAFSGWKGHFQIPPFCAPTPLPSFNQKGKPLRSRMEGGGKTTPIRLPARLGRRRPASTRGFKCPRPSLRPKGPCRTKNTTA